MKNSKVFSILTSLVYGLTVFFTFATVRAASADGAAVAQVSQDAPTLPVTVGSNSQLIRYMGRFAVEPTGMSCAWPASAVYIRFSAQALNVRLSESSGGDEYDVFFDGIPSEVLAPSAGEHVYRLSTGTTSGIHTLGIVKRTETFCGTGTFEGVELSAKGRLLKPVGAAHRLEIIGDSISCGYGDEGANQNIHFSSTTEDGAFAYGADAARLLDADLHCIAWSGKLMWPDNTMPELYSRTLAADSSSDWEYSSWIPDVIVINLSTNDFRSGAPDESGWTGGYEAFINRLRAYYPKAVIYCSTSPMLGGDQSVTLKTYLDKIIADETASGDNKVKFMPIQTQDRSLGLGADWHPNIANQRLAAAVVVTTINQDLGWKIVPDPSSNETLTSLLALPAVSLTSNNGN